ncbi:MAG: hypothetical protein EAZ73_09215 [Oscillatoriales cyanobacterium]|uniref:hypothetical protein n=1 Tax=unclassified Microcoleus TaxID=2642155 RepID=UPI001D57AB57|nr:MULTISPECIES: hypothetical protein [unclassified Microcoleus]TAF00846.1 MAG: hypothetical protein EAZ79_01380 [Oscillatoriales cyanobacterium]MCC3459816.1 hypothetical protein [Microcoleus sp. PH2017_11_PCY_U_A]MCC3478250.1 hypothetical protein [Microcoleus sp. PH2017_12_PCY_D_A]TAF21395.1 MAG: hypothetical protein EAZ73_09215 [Oscillatoriales cyanobacterium]TAF39678.1 MAG: hypothetical protein EAZ69_00130 [Oscillatoriales cyanobacterium]
MFIEFNGVSIEFEQLLEQSYWSNGNPGDWTYSIENGTYWGISSTLEQAFSQAKIDFAKLKEDFNVTDSDLACEWQARHGIDRVYLDDDNQDEF